jgi:predicted MFS family arabinose efflux permease
LGWIVATPIAGMLAQSLSWRAAQVVPAGIALAALAANRGARPAPKQSTAPQLAALMRVQSARRWLGAEVIAYGAWTALLTFVGAFFIERLGASQVAAGWMLAAGAGAHFAASSRSGTLVARVPRRRLLAGSAAIMAILFFVLLGLTASAPAGVATFCLVGFAAGVRSPASTGSGSSRCPTTRAR